MTRSAPRAIPAVDLAAFPELACVRNLLPAHTLDAVAARADALGTGADRVLIAQGLIDEATYLERLSVRFGIAVTDLAGATLANAGGERDAGLAARSGTLNVRIDGRSLTVTTLRGLRARKLIAMAVDQPRAVGHLRLTTEAALQDFLLYRTRGIIGPAVGRLRETYPALSAAPVARSWLGRQARAATLALATVAALALCCMFPAAIGNLLALVFLAAIALRLVASIIATAAPPPQPVRDPDLPDYTVIAALYREARTVPQLLSALTAFDYPHEKLDVILVVETDDLATRAAIARAHPPPCVRVVVAPSEGPRTKPKALNVALPFARGEYVAIYDAEDRPDRDQLRVALAAFRDGDANLACVQARLAIDNSADSLFTRMFAAEYAGQFDIVMPGYDRLRLPWPLGGTSNHFRADRLREVCAWDPFNVTEDADLGLRFARFRYTTATVDSTTWEEAPIKYRAWLHQRTRWMKGWMQTWWVHARHPRRYFRRTGWRGLIARDLVIGGGLLAALAFPLVPVVLTAAAAEYVATGECAVTGALASPLHIASLVGGLAVSIFIQARGLARRGRLRHAWVLTLTLIYWGLLSIAAWRAVLQLRKAPHKWEKTEHGLTRRRAA